MTCPLCGCDKPCACDNYTPDDANLCGSCGCTKPCACDGYYPGICGPRTHLMEDEPHFGDSSDLD